MNVCLRMPKNSRAFSIGAITHLTLVAVAGWGGLAFANRWPVALLYAVAVVAAVPALVNVPRFSPKWLRTTAILVGCAWLFVFAVVVGFLLLFRSSLDLQSSLSTGRSQVAGYVGCDGPTVDPCILVRQEWRVVPGAYLVRPLYFARGKEFAIERVDDRSVRVIAPAFHGELDRESETRILALADSPWTWRPEGSLQAAIDTPGK